MLNGLAEPARRYFKYVIGEAAPIRTVAVIRMSGELGLGTKDKPNCGPMQAEQILAPPHGLVWKLDAGRGFKRITGSDGFDQRFCRASSELGSGPETSRAIPVIP
jgi:hypothetical protein